MPSLTNAEARQQAAYTRGLLASNSEYIIGVDEVGTGAWAGPIVIGAVVLPSNWSDSRIKDSKKYSSHSARIEILDLILEQTKVALVEAVPVSDIDTSGLRQSWCLAVQRVISAARTIYPDALAIVDGDYIPPVSGPALSLIKADSIVTAVSAASILAKIRRDTMMHVLATTYPGYGFEKHVGYGTEGHQAAILQLGICPEHRRSYRPIQRLKAQWESRQKKPEMHG